MIPTPDPTRHPALELPIDQIRWATAHAPRDSLAVYDALRPRVPWYRRRSVLAAAVLAALGGLGVAAATSAAADPRLAEPGCAIYTVQPGDNLTRIARDHGLTLDTVLAWNPQFDDADLIFVDDQVCVGRDGAASVNEVQRVEATPTSVDVTPYLAERESDGRLTHRAVLAALYAQGARGHQLIGLAAVTEAESGRRLDAIGDATIQTSRWGVSAGAWQIRTIKAERGQGTTRDLDRVLTLQGGALSAIELYDQAQTRGQDPLSPWSVHLHGLDKGMVPTYRQLATEMGLL